MVLRVALGVEGVIFLNLKSVCVRPRAITNGVMTDTSVEIQPWVRPIFSASRRSTSWTIPRVVACAPLDTIMAVQRFGDNTATYSIFFARLTRILDFLDAVLLR